MAKRFSPLTLAVSTLIGVAGGMIGAAWYVTRRVNPVPQRTYLDAYTFTPWEFAIPYEVVALQTNDGLRLGGWWLPQPDAQSVVVGCHGHIGAKDELLGIGTSLWRAGHNVLLFDFRGRGDSDAWPNTLISREVEDLLTAVAFVLERVPNAKVGVIGYSMGAAVTLLAAAREPAISAVVADSPFASATDVVASGVRQALRIPAAPLVTLADILGQQWHGYRLSQVRPIDAAHQLAPRPLLLIHCVGDTLIPIEHAQRIFAAAHEPKELWTVDDGDHCGAYFADRVGYVARVAAFFNQYLRSVEG